MHDLSRGVVVAGAGQAAVQLGVALRSHGYDRPIALVGDERYLPYQRPPLSKAVLAEGCDPEEFGIREAEYYRSHDIELVLGEAVVDVERLVDGGVARTSGGRDLPFGRLVLAVGARPRKLDVEGSTLGGIAYLRTLDDALALRDGLASCRSMVVIGGGFVGVEVAMSARAQGIDVTVVESAGSILGRVVGPFAASRLEALHRAAGAQILVGAGVRRFVGDAKGRVAGVELSDGTRLNADLVVISVGASPRTDLARLMGLDCGAGIIVDEQCVTSDGSTLAIGDCAEMPQPYARATTTGLTRLESINNAVEQATAAAGTIMGSREPYRLVPWFWSDQGSVKLQIVGTSAGCDDAVLRDHGPEKCAVLYFASDTLIGGDFVNNPGEFLTVKNAIRRGQNLSRTAAADLSAPLKTALTPASV